jgi:hypothetical protein
MMLTATYHYACNTLNIGADAFVLSGAQKLPPPDNTLYINRF